MIEDPHGIYKRLFPSIRELVRQQVNLQVSGDPLFADPGVYAIVLCELSDGEPTCLFPGSAEELMREIYGGKINPATMSVLWAKEDVVDGVAFALHKVTVAFVTSVK